MWRVISPPASHWALQVLEIANSRTVAAPGGMPVCGEKPPDGRLLTVTTWCPRGRYSLFLLGQAPVELSPLIIPSTPSGRPLGRGPKPLCFSPSLGVPCTVVQVGNCTTGGDTIHMPAYVSDCMAVHGGPTPSHSPPPPRIIYLPCP